MIFFYYKLSFCCLLNIEKYLQFFMQKIKIKNQVKIREHKFQQKNKWVIKIKKKNRKILVVTLL